ncbi:MAG: hypothetical protein ACE5FZ_00965 [Nitrospiria bacterium]
MMAAFGDIDLSEIDPGKAFKPTAGLLVEQGLLQRFREKALGYSSVMMQGQQAWRRGNFLSIRQGHILVQRLVQLQ